MREQVHADQSVEKREPGVRRAVPPPGRLRPDAATVLALQRSAGNRAVTQLLQRDYEGERSDSPLPDAPVELTFDGNRLRMSGGGVDYSWDAVSGRPDSTGGFDYSQERQRHRG